MTTATEFSANQLVTHNGRITITSNKTGDHRTFEIKTIKKGPLEGKRTISLLTGPCNTGDYTPFAFVASKSKTVRPAVEPSHPDAVAVWGHQVLQVNVFKKKRGTSTSPSAFDRYRKMLLNLDYLLEIDAIEIQFEGRCVKCNRPLTDPTSIELGIGPICRGE